MTVLTMTKIDPALFKRMWANPEIKRDEVAQHFAITPQYATRYAKALGLPKRQTGGYRQRGALKVKAAPPAPKVVSGILQTQGKYALLAAYADANGLSYAQALAMWHRERAAR
jgi:hypothetical protein